jgi:myosin-1
LTLRAEQEEYASEGIQWSPIPFFDNKVVCDLIESKRPPGVFAILDDTCKAMHAGHGDVDAKFCEKLKSAQGKHKHYAPFRGGFQILHYAGEVNYNAQGFIAANKDTLFQDLQLLCQGSTVSLIRNLYPDQVNVDQRRQPTTAAHKIKSQCADLVYTLMDCSPHYIRCLKVSAVLGLSCFFSTPSCFRSVTGRCACICVRVAYPCVLATTKQNERLFAPTTLTSRS